ncbi:aminotransferase-like domain-containing protein [Sphingobacterium psychroaquaticum]|uniref:DNA-binding transcriptional regulator, MocR family, contains an aminotransferase domain n=1 Tax=Sphingobacterium psychroaquaticum TaxID=561061 RepID=A0A1X7IKH4_9SPHI|nr:PLP-dependent aminotransferase family protein [Sphingobacterium psychroaquaticum]QBQ41420.1 PLP-dependent aminotransferase family protein [Sphingobacterium psychroaquaticum]SMG15388.1 DNA-binding transcriptional regulator, MocR family, contains an aminotransferase domain [Sphingobacterium psychroaquaticum]
MLLKKEPLYLHIANLIEEQILAGTLQLGDKLPSIRTVEKMHNVSINTVKQAFLLLESKSLIESRPRSGYFVSKTSMRRFALPTIGDLAAAKNIRPAEDLIDKVFNTLKQDVTQFSLGVPGDNMLPIAKLNKSLIKVISRLPDGGTAYEPVQGSPNLRRSVAKWSMHAGAHVTEEDLVTTSGAMNALSNCLMAVTKPGDTIAVETPTYFGTLQLAKSLGLQVIEIPSHPITGLELDALKKVLHKIDICCFTANFSNPLGSLMPEEHKIELVRLLTDYNIPLIEDDLYGNLFFGPSRPAPCKAYDEAGIVMWCGSVSKTLAPGYRVGWVAPGKFKDRVIRQKLLHTISTPILYQEVIADFMENGRYEHYLRNFRNRLYANCMQYQRSVEAYFPENTKIAQPQGGFVLWLELDAKIDTAALYDRALQQKISFAPGRIFTLQDRYHNCMRLNYALDWNDQLENDIKRLGNIVKSVL